MPDNLIFVKLGGSLITDKSKPHTPRLDVLERIANEIAQARNQEPQTKILLGHGSGSYGHIPASHYQTRMGVKTVQEWMGFAEVWRQAADLNHLVLLALQKADLPALAFAPSSMVLTSRGKVVTWNLEPIQRALQAGILPVIYGDVTFDEALGGTILSTEDLFSYLADFLLPKRLLLAGSQPGVWADFPENTRLLAEITPSTYSQIEIGLRGSTATDVTGGMADKVRQVLSLLQTFPHLSASIFSGETPGNILKALLGERLGTEVHC